METLESDIIRRIQDGKKDACLVSLSTKPCLRNRSQTLELIEWGGTFTNGIDKLEFNSKHPHVEDIVLIFDNKGYADNTTRLCVYLNDKIVLSSDSEIFGNAYFLAKNGNSKIPCCVALAFGKIGSTKISSSFIASETVLSQYCRAGVYHGN